jgi:SAM-dependent methyltransferase
VTADHDQRHGGTRPPGHDAAHWDERYRAADRLWSAEPNATVAEVVGPLAPGRALDVGAGEGRHAVWLAGRGWQVTAVDFSAVGIERGRTAATDIAVDWVVADVRTWQPPAGTTYDLVLVAYLHLADDVLGRVAGWLAEGATLVVLGHALRNLTDGVGGPQDPRLLHTEDQLRAAATGLVIERLGEVLRPTSAGNAIDFLLVARRASAAAGYRAPPPG